METVEAHLLRDGADYLARRADGLGQHIRGHFMASADADARLALKVSVRSLFPR